MKQLPNNNQGFTLIEIMVVVFVLAILSSITISALSDARQRNRDVQRVSDISQLQVALSAFKRDNGTYPVAITAGEEIRGVTSTATTTVYISQVPTPPTPQDGNCADYPIYTSYYYLPTADYSKYCLFFCLGYETSDVTADAKMAIPNGIIDVGLGNVACY